MDIQIDKNWKERTELLIGREGLAKLEKSHVLIVGLGGVGGFAAEMLCRAGIGCLSLADGDIYKSSNLNRQTAAFASTLGQSKVSVIASRLKDINPEVRLNVINEYLKDQALSDLLERYPYDYVIDAIDTLSPKVYLIVNALRLKLPLVSSMGAGGKFDPQQIKVADIADSYQCRLAYVLRKRLRKFGIQTGFDVVFSTEAVESSSVIPDESEQNKKSTVGTISYLPPVFGAFCASVVLRNLIKNV